MSQAIPQESQPGSTHLLLDFFAPLLGTPPTPEQVYLAETEQKHVQTVLASINGRMAGILLLGSEGLSYSEMAGALDIAPSYIGSLLSRAQEAVVVRQVIQVQELQAALARAGAHEVQVPPEWQGSRCE
jgi:DNA-directed RNA polymerase specialized sigma24 family protein